MQMARFLLVALLIWPPAALAQARIIGPAHSSLSVTPATSSQIANLAKWDSVRVSRPIERKAPSLALSVAAC